MPDDLLKKAFPALAETATTFFDSLEMAGLLVKKPEPPKRKKTLDKAGGWQPIRTAPKDRDILLLVDIAIGRPLIVQCCWYSVDADDKGWIDANGDVFLATHWMPLPAPPRDS